MSTASRIHPEPTNLQILASALSTIPGSNSIRIRKGQTPTQDDAFQSLLYTLSLMTAAMRKARSPRHNASRRVSHASNSRSTAA